MNGVTACVIPWTFRLTIYFFFKRYNAGPFALFYEFYSCHRITVDKSAAKY
ncbi:hypothetical protein CoNPh26_CDS0177 [Staphylococcus phage S-CoN_Ph26]|nr:hypothetical protein CoNPh26_CDS0177 [Staphylococcus phage S-CoN_Ph26]